MMNVNIKLLDERLKFPEYFPQNSPANAGTDLRACIDIPVALAPGGSVKISSGIAVAIPEGFFGLVTPRSGLGSKGIHLKNVAGIIDASYRGPVTMNIVNNGDDFVTISAMDRVMQMLVLPVQHVVWNAVDNLVETGRGSCGFGASGNK